MPKHVGSIVAAVARRFRSRAVLVKPATVVRWHRQGLIDARIEQHHGRFVNSAGDSLFAEFVSVVEAVNCAVDIQTGFKTENASLPPERRMEALAWSFAVPVPSSRAATLTPAPSICSPSKLVADTVAEILFLRVAAQVDERQHSDRRNIRQGQHRFLWRRNRRVSFCGG